MEFDYETTPKGEYWGDFSQRFVMEAYREVRDGRECYAYSKANLEQIIEILESKKIKFIVKESKDGYWVIRPHNARYMENVRKNKKDKKQAD